MKYEKYEPGDIIEIGHHPGRALIVTQAEWEAQRIARGFQVLEQVHFAQFYRNRQDYAVFYRKVGCDEGVSWNPASGLGPIVKKHDEMAHLVARMKEIYYS